MVKVQFGDILREARAAKAFSLRELADRVGIDYSRLARIEQGTRPAPGLAEIRRLSETLELDMADLLVAAGTSREVMGHLVWSERIHTSRSTSEDASCVPEISTLAAKNTYDVRVLERDGALCTVALGNCELHVFSFADALRLSVCIPPEGVVVHRDRAAAGASTADNVLPARIKKIRRLGQVTNLVLAGDGFELNSVHVGRRVAELALGEGDAVLATIQATSIRTKPTP